MADTDTPDPTYRYAQTEMIESLKDEHGIFESYKDVIIFLGVLGYREGEPSRDKMKDMEGEIGEIDYSTFMTTSLYKDILASMAFQYTDDPDSLVDRQKHLEVLDSYAVGGLQVMHREFGDIKGDPTDAIVNLLQSYEEYDQRSEGELQTILDAFKQDTRLGG